MVDFTILLLPGSWATSTSLTLDSLAVAARLAPGMGLAVPVWRVVSPGGGLVRLSSGLHVETTRAPAPPRRGRSVWVVPGLGVDRAEDLQRRLNEADTRQAADLLRHHHEAGGTVAASCSSVFLLQRAGLLAGRTVTTSWWLAGALRGLAPTCCVDGRRMVCDDGDVVTAGGSTAQGDLMLYLMRRRWGSPLADRVGRALMTELRPSQAVFVIPAAQAGSDVMVQRLTALIDQTLPASPSVKVLAASLAISERTLARRVKAATGESPLALIQSVRLHRAQRLIEDSQLSVADIAREVGFEDPSALRRLLKQAGGITPSGLRQRRRSPLSRPDPGDARLP